MVSSLPTTAPPSAMLPASSFVVAGPPILVYFVTAFTAGLGAYMLLSYSLLLLLLLGSSHLTLHHEEDSLLRGQHHQLLVLLKLQWTHLHSAWWLWDLRD